MDNLWILTEERPKRSVVESLLNLYRTNNNLPEVHQNLKIRPMIHNDKFLFYYKVENVVIPNIGHVFIKIINGYSSFLDYMVIKQESLPTEHSLNNILFMVEETKTSDAESRNTGIGQRATKFAYANYYCPNVPKYMLYNDETTDDYDRIPSDTNVFGTNMLLTQGVHFIGKNMRFFSAFDSIDELISKKNGMRKPPAGNVPINIIKLGNNIITISGRLAKPKDAGNIAHDPNIGTLTCIAYTLRVLGWEGRIIITHHGVNQNYVNRNKNNKFLRICHIYNLELENIDMPNDIVMPEFYWHYSMTSEKVASILLHLACDYYDITSIYENHAGCERGYFTKANNMLIPLPKKDANGNNLLIPDVVLKNDIDHEIYLIEGKLFSTMQDGIIEIQLYDSIENEYIRLEYPGYRVSRWVTLFGDNHEGIPNNIILLYVNQNGNIYLNETAPYAIKNIFRQLNS